MGARATRTLARSGPGRRGGRDPRGPGGATRCVPRVRDRGTRPGAGGPRGGAAPGRASRARPRMRARHGPAASRVRGLARDRAWGKRRRPCGPPRHHSPGATARRLARHAGALQPPRGRNVARAQPADRRSARERRRHPAVLPGVPGHAGAADRPPGGAPQPVRAPHPRAHRAHPGAVPLLRAGEGLAGRRPALSDPPFR